MPIRLILILALPWLWLAGCTSAPTAARPGTNRVTVITGDIPTLTPGMTAAEVWQKLGEPADIKPQASAEGTVETWTYQLEKYLGQTQVATFQSRPALSGSFANDIMAGVPDQVYTLVDRKLLVTLRLLMINGRLHTLTAKREEILDY